MFEKLRKLWHRKITWTWAALVLVFVICLSILQVSAVTRKLPELQSEKTDLMQRLSWVESEHNELSERLENLDSKASIEAIARSDYEYVKQGEIRFVVTNPEELDRYTEEETQNLLNEMALISNE